MHLNESNIMDLKAFAAILYRLADNPKPGIAIDLSRDYAFPHDAVIFRLEMEIPNYYLVSGKRLDDILGDVQKIEKFIEENL